MADHTLVWPGTHARAIVLYCMLYCIVYCVLYCIVLYTYLEHGLEQLLPVSRSLAGLMHVKVQRTERNHFSQLLRPVLCRLQVSGAEHVRGM